MDKNRTMIPHNPGYRIEGEDGVRWAGNAGEAFLHLISLCEDRGLDIKWTLDYNDCFMCRLKEDRIEACVYDCPNCLERRQRKPLLVMQFKGSPLPEGCFYGAGETFDLNHCFLQAWDGVRRVEFKDWIVTMPSGKRYVTKQEPKEVSEENSFVGSACRMSDPENAPCQWSEPNGSCPTNCKHKSLNEFPQSKE